MTKKLIGNRYPLSHFPEFFFFFQGRICFFRLLYSVHLYPENALLVTMWFTQSEPRRAEEPLSLLFWYELKVLKWTVPLECFCHVQDGKRGLLSGDSEEETVYI